MKNDFKNVQNVKKQLFKSLIVSSIPSGNCMRQQHAGFMPFNTSVSIEFSATVPGALVAQ
ncbi:hypothetical protein DPMN_123803 [Dreissena polymorpha]|uniref:Uncharacterized protein n=1 Tax=Dreissena polymorpha TaxID=45954 RepID=A0A9D4JT84_DREPO|nr:hypothetical protein DPMN_123803 [Dreissena polymorpha]